VNAELAPGVLAQRGEPAPVSDSPHGSSRVPLIELADVTKTFHTGDLDVEILHGVSLKVYPGEYLAIMGASGSGKTTLMNILGCLDRPTKGRYMLDGTAVSELNRKQLAVLRNHKLGFVFQSFNLLARTTALENVELPMFYSNKFLSLRLQKESALKALEKVGLTDRAAHHPSQLSGGQQQRVALARALVNEPEVILADEPTGNLDSHSGAEVIALFHALHASGRTIILITHDVDVAAVASRQVHLRDGRIAA